jgi:hypothetical protein
MFRQISVERRRDESKRQTGGAIAQQRQGVRVTAALTDLAHSVHDWRERRRVSSS